MRPLPAISFSVGSPRKALSHLWLSSIWRFFCVQIMAKWGILNKHIGINWPLYTWDSDPKQYFSFCWPGVWASEDSHTERNWPFTHNMLSEITFVISAFFQVNVKICLSTSEPQVRLPTCCGQKEQPQRLSPGKSMQVVYRASTMVATISGGEKATKQVHSLPGGSPSCDLGAKEVAQRRQHVRG